MIFIFLIVYFAVGIWVLRKLLYPGVDYKPSKSLPPWLKESFAEIEGYRIRYFTYFPSGDSKVCVLHHGLGDSSEALWAEAELLRKLGFGILMVDLLGHGKSTKVATSFGRKESRILIDLINRLELRERIEIMWGRSTGAACVLFISSQIFSCKALILDGLFDTEIKSVFRHSYKLKKYWASLIFIPFILGYLYLLKSKERHLQEPLTEIKKSPLPILFIAGSNDAGADHFVQRKLYAVSTNEESRLVILQGPHHNQCFAKDPSVYEEWIKLFWRARELK